MILGQSRSISVAAVLLALLALTFPSAYASALTHTWSANYGDSGTQSFQVVKFDPIGHIVATGSFQSSIDFGGGALNSAGGWDIYLVKLDGAGNHLWSGRFGSTGDQFVTGMDVDVAGNIVITGIFYGSIDFGGGVLTSAGDLDFFVAKFRWDGAHQWSMRFGDAQSQRYNINPTVAFDIIGDVIMTGQLSNTADFGGAPLVGASEVFLAKFSSMGGHNWSGVIDVAGGAVDVTTDAFANAIIVTSGGSGDFGGGPVSGVIGLAKYNAFGAHVWSQAFPGGCYTQARKVVVDNFGAIVIAGSAFCSGLDLGGGPYPWFGSIFIARYDAGGGYLMSAHHGSTNIIDLNGLYAMTTDANGNIIAGGRTHTGWGVPLPGPGDRMILACYDSTGAHVWSEKFFDAPGYFFSANARWGSVISGGIVYPGFVYLGGDTLTTNGDNDSFIARWGGDMTGIQPESPVAGRLIQAYPNPFNPSITVSYEVDRAGPVSMTILDVSGAVVARPIQNLHHDRGRAERTLSLDNLASGIYFIRIETAATVAAHRITLLK